MNDMINIEPKSPEVEIVQGSITADLDTIKNQAEQVAEYVSSVIVTEDTVKSSKKLIAQVNKMAKSLEDERISIKKQMLEPYIEFESKVKDIVAVIKEADNIVRSQIKELDELEREKKKEVIESIWSKRAKHYDLKDIVTFDDFLTAQHLNKSMSLKKVEDDMVSFLERVKNDLKAIERLDNHIEILQVYGEVKDVSQAIEITSNRNEQRKRIEQQQSKRVEEDIFTFTVKGKKDKKLVEMLLKENDIDYDVV